MKTNIEDIRALIEAADTMADMQTLENGISLTEQGVDSLDLANILLLLEEKFEIKIPDEDTRLLSTVDGIVNYINNKQ